MSTKTEIPTRTYSVNIETQVNDGLITSNDMIEYLKAKMKVKNSNKIASMAISFEDKSTTVDISAREGDIRKQDMKLYIKRYLRTKSLRNYIRVTGDSNNGIKLEYINKVDSE